MDQFEEKKWFVFLGDHHEGPFSISEIQPKIEQKQIGSSHFVWAEGMPDWVPMHEVEAFSALKTARPDEATSLPEPAPNPAMIFEEPKLDAAALPELRDINVLEPDFTRTSELEIPKKSDATAPPRVGVILKLLLIILGVGALAFGGKLALDRSDSWLEKLRPSLNDQIISIIENHPSIASLISPLPHLSGVSAEDFESLKAAAASSLNSNPPSIAVAVSKENPNSPVFYVASNLPDGTRFDILIEGVRETLVTKLVSDTKLSVVLDHRLAVSKPLMMDGKPLPQGEYRVSATEAQEIQGAQLQPPAVRDLLAKLQPLNAEKTEHLPAGIKLLSRKGYFLGGAKDAAYNQKLREFHEGLKQKARMELEELRLFLIQLEAQLNTTVAQFNMYRKTKSPTKKKNWFPFDEFWRKQQTPLSDMIKKWSPEGLSNDYVYGPMYLSAQQAMQAVQKLHELQKDYFDKKLDEKAVDIQVGETQAAAQGMILGLKTKIDEIEKAAPPANGLPAGI